MAKKSKKSKSLAHTQGLFPYVNILARDADNVRQTSMGDIQELSESIVRNGLLEPIGILLIEKPTSDDISAEDLEMMGLEEIPDQVGILRYGFRRYAAIGLALAEDENLFSEGVPVVFLAADADEVTGVAQNISENLDRENITPGELAERLSVMAETMAPADIAARIGRSPTYVSGLLRLKKQLIEDAWNEFYGGSLSFDVANVIAKSGRDAAKEAKEEGEDKDTQTAANEKAQKSALKRALAALASVKDGAKNKRGVKAAAEGGEGSPRPSKKKIADQLSSLKRLKKTEKTPEIKAVIAALEWVTGEKADMPFEGAPEPEAEKPAKKEKAAPAKKGKPAKATKPAKKAKAVKEEEEDEEEEETPKKKAKTPPKPAKKTKKVVEEDEEEDEEEEEDLEEDEDDAEIEEDEEVEEDEEEEKPAKKAKAKAGKPGKKS